MIARSLRLLSVATLLVATPLSADLVVLHSGERIEGRIVNETTDGISIRRAFADGRITYLQKINRSDVARIERRDEVLTSQPAAAASRPVFSGPAASASLPPVGSRPATRAATQPEDLSAPPRRPTADKLQLFESAVTNWRKKDHAAAGILLSRLINNATEGELVYLSIETQRRLEMSLAELAADNRFAAAMAQNQGRTVRFSYVTQYERPALMRRVARAYEEALRQRVRTGVRMPPPSGAGTTDVASRPAPSASPLPPGKVQRGPEQPPAEPIPRFDSIPIWIDRPEEFDGDKAAADAFEAHIRYTMSLLTERLRLDLVVHKDPALRAELVQDRVRLANLLDAVRARAAGALTPQERAAILAEKKRLEEQYRKRMEEMQKQQQENIQQAIKFAEEQEKAESGGTATPGASP